MSRLEARHHSRFLPLCLCPTLNTIHQYTLTVSKRPSHMASIMSYSAHVLSFIEFYQCLNPAVIISCLDCCHDLITELSASYLNLLHSILYISVKVNFLNWKFNHVTPLLGNIPSLSSTYVINNKFLIWPLPSLGELLSTVLQPKLFTSTIPDDFDPLVASFTLLEMPFLASLSGNLFPISVQALSLLDIFPGEPV